MNRRERRAAKTRFIASCAMCDAETCVIHVLGRRAIYADDPSAPDDLGICRGCPCSAGMCDSCGETGQHWLGCTAVGLPSMPEEKGERTT